MMSDDLFKIEKQVDLADADAKCNEELQMAIVEARINTTHDVLRKIRPQMNLVVTSLYNELEQTRRAQREKMIADFNNIMRYLLTSKCHFERFSMCCKISQYVKY